MMHTQSRPGRFRLYPLYTVGLRGNSYVFRSEQSLVLCEAVTHNCVNLKSSADTT